MTKAPDDLQLPKPTAAPQPPPARVEVVVVEKSTIERTLPELVSGFVKKVMEDPASLNQCGRDLQLWHDAQSLENRQQLVRDTKKAIETAKLSMEWLFSEYQRMSAKYLG